MSKVIKETSPQKGEIIIYKPKTGDARLKVKLEQETVWLSQKQMAGLFNKNVRTINEHINNIFREKELKKSLVIRNFRITASDRKQYNTNFYNLDMIISVGYRVNSKQGTKFRIWATKTIRDYIVKGVVVNQRRLRERQKMRLSGLERTIALLQDVMQRKELEGDEKAGLLKVITDYANSWILLERYDKKSLEIKGSKKAVKVFEYEESKEIIKELKKKLLKKKEAGRYFGIEREQGLEGILGNLNQEIADKPLYNSIEERAAHLLYFVIKDHVFVDGNKRIASLLFILFLSRNNFLYNRKGEKRINDNTLTALALLVAESRTQEKETMVALITNLLT
ncbi:MAG: virulence protein RhuM/Fic/DOC family protein [Parcubacteria group bacterium]|nr:virulence protein RhuM/Fic/DOC family protein [Parcubacteria group bacterium]